MIDVSRNEIGFRGYPVAAVSDDCCQRLLLMQGTDVLRQRTLLAVLDRMEDTAGPGEPSGWLFEARLPLGDRVWLERCGGVRDAAGHGGGHWVMFLPEER